MKKSVAIIFGSVSFLFLTTPMALAADPGIVIGTKNLLEDALTWILVLIPVGCACVIAWHAFCKELNEGDPPQAAVHGRAMKTALITSAIGASAAGIAKAFLSYYGG